MEEVIEPPFSQVWVGHRIQPKHRIYKTLSIFSFFINHFINRVYEMGIFAKLADKGLLGCNEVVGARSQES